MALKKLFPAVGLVVTGLLAAAVTVTGASGCSRKAAVSQDRTLQQQFPGPGCKDLKVEVGTYESICSKSPSWAAACPVGWKELEGAKVAMMHGAYQGPLCLLNHDDCTPPEKVDFVAAALKLPGGAWEPGGLFMAGDRKVDVRATLLAGCSTDVNAPKR